MCAAQLATTALGVLLALSAWAGQKPSSDLDRQFQSAAAHYNAGQYAAAQEELETLAQSIPNNFEVQEMLGLVYSAQGQEQKARAPLEHAVRLRPQDGPARNNLATNLARLGETALAEKEFQKVVELEPENYDAHHNLGEFYIRLENIPAAIPHLKKAQEENPAAYDNGYDLALAYEQTHQLPEARRQIQTLLKQKNTAELHNLLAEVEERSGNFVTAVKEYETAAHMDPSESNIFDWGCEFLAHQTPKPAAEVFSDGVKRYPDSVRLTIGLGLALYLQGNYDDAVRALLRATDLNPSDPREYYFLSRAYDHSPGEANEVIDRFRRFAELHPSDGLAAYYYAMSVWKGKRSETSKEYLDQVEALLKKAVALDPSSADAHLQLGNLYSQRGQYAEAVPEYQRALKLSPAIPDAHFRLGQAYVHLGQKDLAQNEFQLHQKLYQKHLADIDEQRSKIQQFVYSMKEAAPSQ